MEAFEPPESPADTRCDELRADLERALSLIPGKHRLNLHAIYADYGGRIRLKFCAQDISPAEQLGPLAWPPTDFNPEPFFSHPKADDDALQPRRGRSPILGPAWDCLQEFGDSAGEFGRP